MTGTTVQILPPKGNVALGKYRNRTGVFIIRLDSKVLYVGWSRSLGATCVRYFSKKGGLEQYNIRLVTFEMILCKPKTAARLASALKRYYTPTENKVYPEPRMNPKEKATCQLLLLNYCNNSRVAPQSKGSHQSDE